MAFNPIYLPGASAASAALRNSGGGDTPEGEETDPGDGVNNDMVLR